MGSRRRDRTILGMGAVQIPSFATTLVDAKVEELEEDEEPSRYRSWVGRVVDGRYRLDRLIAEGGMGAVFEARRVDGGPPVALKVMHPELEGNAAIVQRFHREVEIGRRLTHPHIVAALDTGTMEDGSAYLVLELVTGPSLSIAMWEDGPFGWARAARVGAEVAAALAAAWSEGIVHRDLKPDNVILEPDPTGRERVKLLDFGIAHDQTVTNEKLKLTLVGEVIGTVGYMAPEQTLGQPVDGRCDVYTLGVLIWEMLAGRALFDEDLSHPQFLTVQLKERPQPIRELAPETPEPLADLVHRLLAYPKAERPEDAETVRVELLRLLGESPTPAVTASTGAPQASAPTSQEAASHQPASHQPATHEPASHQPAPDQTAPSHAAPDHAALDHGALDHAGPGGIPSRAERRAGLAPKRPLWPILVGLALVGLAGLALVAAVALLVFFR